MDDPGAAAAGIFVSAVGAPRLELSQTATTFADEFAVDRLGGKPLGPRRSRARSRQRSCAIRAGSGSKGTPLRDDQRSVRRSEQHPEAVAAAGDTAGHLERR